MKRSILFITFLCLFFTLNLQSQTIKKGDIISLKTKVSTIGEPKAIISTDNILKNNTNYLGKYNYTVYKISDSTVELAPLNFKPYKKKRKKRIRKKRPNTIFLDEIYNNKIYTISKEDYDAFNAPEKTIDDRLSIGLLTLPFKARPQDGLSFDTEFNISSTLNIKIKNIFGNTSLNYQIGAGIGSVGLNPNNASGIDGENSQDVATLTLLNGLMFQYNKVQVGFYCGVDHINNQSYYDWNSNGNIWLGFGIGYNLFNISISNNNNGN